MSLLLDTNTVIALIGNSSDEARSRFKRALRNERVAVSTIVLFELWFGVLRSSRQLENAERLRDFCTIGFEVLPLNEEDAIRAAELRSVLKDQGTPIGPYDVLIAGQALRNNMTLVTANVREFERVQGLKWQNWLASKSK